ncbi:unnamed protein product, partial [Allacma fusca]
MVLIKGRQGRGLVLMG